MWNNKIEANKNTRNSAYNELIEKCKEKYSAANKEFVSKNIHTVMYSFRKEFKKVQLSKESAVLRIIYMYTFQYCGAIIHWHLSRIMISR